MQMRIHKEPSNSASLKRKAEDSGDAYEFKKEDTPKQGHETKKAKPTSGYVPGTGKPYRGTGRDMPNPRSSAYARALENKSTNASLKSREKIRKQDTKNLNRNIPKTKVPYDVGASSSCRVPLANIVDVQGYEPTHSESTNPRLS